MIQLTRAPEGKALLAELYGSAGVEAQAERWRILAQEFFAGVNAPKATLVSSPGRTELGGNHTDHNGGRVLCAAVHLDMLAVAALRKDDQVILRSHGWSETFVVDLADLSPHGDETGRPEALIRGVAAGMAARNATIGGFEALVDSIVPAGSGLSSSAAFELLVAQIFNALFNENSRSPEELALVGKEAENRFFGKPCGLMDQMACALGGISAIDFADPAKPAWSLIDFDLEKAGYVLAIVNTGDSHADLTDDYAGIPDEMGSVAGYFGVGRLREVPANALLLQASRIRAATGDRALLRALHFSAEDGRAVAMASALVADRFDEYLALVRASGDSSWRLLQNVVSAGAVREQPLAVAIELSRLYLGPSAAVRVHGGGFAGTIQTYLVLEAVDGYVQFMDGVFGAGATTIMRIRSRGAGEV
ncbi:MAG: galactokinase [Spirochaetales bacterium]|nr:MAG: galactokinase [Spirochaetales bacterium]